jgi:hypothetical protein
MPRPAPLHCGPAPRLAQQAAAASPLRLLPRQQSMTRGDHLSFPSSRRVPLGLPGRVRPTAARAPSVLGPHAKVVHPAFISHTATPRTPYPNPSRPRSTPKTSRRNPSSPPPPFFAVAAPPPLRCRFGVAQEGEDDAGAACHRARGL